MRDLDDEANVWNNGYTYASCMADVIEALADGPLEEDRIARLCIDPRDLDGLLEAEERGREDDALARGFLHFFASGATDPAALSALHDRDVHRERLRAQTSWEDLGPRARIFAWTTARYLIERAEDEGWIERHRKSGAWSATPTGLAELPSLRYFR